MFWFCFSFNLYFQHKLETLWLKIIDFDSIFWNIAILIHDCLKNTCIYQPMYIAAVRNLLRYMEVCISYAKWKQGSGSKTCFASDNFCWIWWDFDCPSARTNCLLLFLGTRWARKVESICHQWFLKPQKDLSLSFKIISFIYSYFSNTM